MIRDEFTSLKISRQRKWQMRKAKEGFCMTCGCRPMVNESRCLECAVTSREANRIIRCSVRRNNSQTYKLQELCGK